MTRLHFYFRGEFYLNDWILKQGNFNRDYITSIFGLEGYFDEFLYESLTPADKAKIVVHRRNGITKNSGKYVYEFIMVPSAGILYENKPLPRVRQFF